MKAVYHKDRAEGPNLRERKDRPEKGGLRSMRLESEDPCKDDGNDLRIFTLPRERTFALPRKCLKKVSEPIFHFEACAPRGGGIKRHR